MKELFHLPQPNNFPEKVNTIIIGEKDLTAIPTYYISGNTDLLFAKDKIIRFPFYVGIIPQTLDSERLVGTFISTDHKLSYFSKVTIIPKYFIKIVRESTYNFILGSLENEKVSLDIEELRRILLNFFGIPQEALIIESDYKAKAYLIQAHKNYSNKFIVVKKL